MLNRYPAWKYALLVVVLLVSVLYALPNLYGEDPAVQVSAIRGAKIDSALVARLEKALEKAKVDIKSARVTAAHQVLIRFPNTTVQLRGQDVIRGALGADYVVALNLAPSTPRWLRDIGAQPMYLGLDLRGGVHFLLRVDMKAALRQAAGRYVADLRTVLREKGLRYSEVRQLPSDAVVAVFREASVRQSAANLIHDKYRDLKMQEITVAGRPALSMTLTPQAEHEVRTNALDQNITTLRNRVNELGVAEPIIQQQGQNYIVVELPGIQDTARAKEILGATATLQFHMVDQTGSVSSAVAGNVPPGDELLYDRQGHPVLLKGFIMLSGKHITNAASGLDQQSGGPAVFITLDSTGARLFSQRTAKEIGRPMATVYINNRAETRIVNGKKVITHRTTSEVINVATIRDRLGKRFQITGLSSTEEARNLALLLRAGSLAAPMYIVEERTVGPSLGQQNINQGMLSVEVGFVVVMLFMGLYYRVFGLFANLALAFNLVIIVALLSMLQATLTLPGIAGIVLTIGMAVDANVLINERIREELRNGNTPQASIHAGYEKAFGTIADSNITTLIAGIVLFGLGTGPVKGFAVTLSLGIATSMFTAIMGTRAIVNLIYGGRRVRKLSI